MGRGFRGEAVWQPQLLPLPNLVSFPALATWVFLNSDLSETQALFHIPLVLLGSAHCVQVGDTDHQKAPLTHFLFQNNDTLALPVTVSK